MAHSLDGRWQGYSRTGDDATKAAPSLTRIWRGYILCLYLENVNPIAEVGTTIYDPYTHEQWIGSQKIPCPPTGNLSSKMPPVAAYADLNTYVIVAYDADPLCFVIPYPTAADQPNDFRTIPNASNAGSLGVLDCDITQRPAIAVFNGQLVFVYRTVHGGLSAVTGSPGGKVTWQRAQPIPGVANVAGGPSLTIFNNQLVCAFTSGTGQVMTLSSADGANWTGPSATPAISAVGPAISPDPLGASLVLMSMPKGGLPIQFFNSTDGKNWSGPGYCDGPTSDAPALIASASRRMLAVVRGSDNYVCAATTFPGIWPAGGSGGWDGSPHPCSSFQMGPGYLLLPGDRVTSSNGQYYLTLQTDGNLVLYTQAGGALWASGTDGHPARFAVMQTDGNLVVYAAGNQALWSSGTDGHNTAVLEVQTDGNAVISYGVTPIWATNTKQAPTPAQSGAQRGSAAGGLLPSNHMLMPGDRVTSSDSNYYMTLQADGNLVLYTKAGGALWASGTSGHSVQYAVMQTDGNLVLYDPANKAYWASNTAGHQGASLTVQTDGNAVIYDAGGHAIWATNTKQAPTPAQSGAQRGSAAGGLLPSNHMLMPGDRATSSDNNYYMTLQADGNLVLYTKAGGALWASGTSGHSVQYAVMQTDGNLVLYDPANKAYWASNTSGHQGASLTVQTDGNAVIYDAGRHAIWATNTKR